LHQNDKYAQYAPASKIDCTDFSSAKRLSCITSDS
jgi:hypothetical protein